MAEAPSIKRRKKTSDPLGFDSLRSEAIKQLQQLSGQRWSDYNLHDPGVTILEQLIYAITDLTYRSDFDIADLLVDESGSIDFDGLNLHSPVEVMPCRASTVRDYRKLILDAAATLDDLLPALDNIWITDMAEHDGANPQFRGLYRFAIKLDQNLDQQKHEDAKEKIRSTYLKSRNLCEDLGEIIVVDSLEYELRADIEVSGTQDPAEILAEIYFECARRVASSININRYDQLAEQDQSLEQLLDGPFTEYGFIRDEDLREQQTEFLLSTLNTTINAIEGVDYLRELCLVRGDVEKYDRIISDGSEQAFDLVVPKFSRDIKVVLTRNGQALRIAFDELLARYRELGLRYHSSRSTPQDLSLLYKPISGDFRPLRQYFSIQNQFPASYGINLQGMPESASNQDKAKARQLKAYLLVFEQLMNNFLANLDSLKTLYSGQIESRKSYAAQVLETIQIDDLEAVYPKNPQAFLDCVVETYDDFSERKSRVLDYLLALYGERVNENAIRQFNFYHTSGKADDMVVVHKVEYLNAIIELGQQRAAAPDYTASPADRRVGGSQLRLATLLGFTGHGNALTSAVKGQEIELCAHDAYLESSAASAEQRLVDAEQLAGSATDGLESVPLIATGEDPGSQSLRGLPVAAQLLDSDRLSDLLFREGVNIDKYQMVRKDSPEYQLLLQIDQDCYWNLGHYKDELATIQAANRMRELLIRLNQHSEGLHLVEHILLRPQLATVELQSESAREADFFSFRLSVIFPGWTTRCHDKAFRQHAEQTVRMNLPAHLYAEIHWLDFEQMLGFEERNDDWLAHKSNESASAVEIDRSATRMIDFLLDLSKKQATRE